MVRVFVLLLTIGIAVPANAQNLLTDRGSRAVEGGAAWPVARHSFL